MKLLKLCFTYFVLVFPFADLAAQHNLVIGKNIYVLDSIKTVSSTGLPPIDRYDLDFYYEGTNQDDSNLKFDLYYVLQRNWAAHQEIGYISPLAYVQSIGAYNIGLRTNEGKRTPFSLFEAKAPVRFTIYKGRPSSNDFSKRIRVTLDYLPNFRMHQDESYPLTPSDHRVGFGFDYAFDDNNKDISRQPDEKYIRSIEELNAGNLLKSWNFSFQLHHYSNGQPLGFFYEEGDKKRNDYRSGDFSTNYMRFGITRNYNYLGSGKLIQASLFWRQDWGMRKGVSFSPEQNNHYGRSRLEWRLDYRPGVFYMGKRISHYQNGRTYLVKKAFQSLWRLEVSTIMDNVDDFRPNLANWQPGDSKYRTSIRAYYQLSPLSHRNIGYMIMAYYGRDYLNIRYDNIVFSLQAGITFSLDKFFPSTYHTNQSIDGITDKPYKGRYTAPPKEGGLPVDYRYVKDN